MGKSKKNSKIKAKKIPNLTKAIEVCKKNANKIIDTIDWFPDDDFMSMRYFLSIIAQEEFAKAFLLKLVKDEAIPWNNEIIRVLNDHRCKQLISQILDYLVLSEEEFMERFKNRKDTPKRIIDVINILRFEKMGEFNRNEWLDDDENIHRTIRKIADGDFEKIKQDAIYIRISKNGEIMSTPEKITTKMAEDEFEKAKQYSSLHIGFNEYERIKYMLKFLFGFITTEEYNDKMQWL